MLAATVVAAVLAVVAPAVAAGEPLVDAARATTTSVAVVSDGVGATTVTVRVSAPGEVVAGSVTLRDGESALAVLPLDRGVAALTTTALTGDSTVTAVFDGDTAHLGSAPPPVTVGRPGAALGTVGVVIPSGSLVLTTGGPGGGVTVTDTRAGDLGFVVSAGLGGGDRHVSAARLQVAAIQVPGNGLRASDVRVPAGPRTLRYGVPRVIAVYPAGLGTGSIDLGWSAVAGGRRCCAPRIVWTVI